MFEPRAGNHSPLPWKIQKVLIDGRISIGPQDDLFMITSAYAVGQSIEERRDNAALIVHRVNLHDPLVDALGRLALVTTGPNSLAYRQALTNAKAMLRRAHVFYKGEKPK